MSVGNVMDWGLGWGLWVLGMGMAWDWGIYIQKRVATPQ